jgi:hypothetical protein
LTRDARTNPALGAVQIQRFKVCRRVVPVFFETLAPPDQSLGFDLALGDRDADGAAELTVISFGGICSSAPSCS